MADELPEEKQVTQWRPEDALAVGLPSVDSINLIIKVADQVKGSALFPKALRDNKANLVAVMLRGRELGMMPMEALQSFFVVSDRLGMYADAMVRHMSREKVKLEWLKDSDDEASIKGTTRDGYSYTSTWTNEESERAGLIKKEHSLHPKYPRNMMRARAIGNLYRTLGIGPRLYTPEEAIEFTDFEPVTAESLQQQAGVEESNGIDERVIRPEDEVRLRQMYKICGLKPEAAVAKLKEIQAEATDRPDANWALYAFDRINREISRLQGEHVDGPAATRKKGGRPRKQTASEMAAQEPARVADEPEAESGAEPEPETQDDLGVTQEDGEREPEQAAFGTTW